MMLQDQLAEKYKYKKLPVEISENAISEYLKSIPSILNINGDLEFKVYSKLGTLISNGYKRIVIGDYGAFLEFDKSMIVRESVCVQRGQEYRINDENYSKNVKYIWLTAKDDSGIKIYYQKKTVSYADYLPELFYVSHYDILLKQN